MTSTSAKIDSTLVKPWVERLWSVEKLGVKVGDDVDDLRLVTS